MRGVLYVYGLILVYILPILCIPQVLPFIVNYLQSLTSERLVVANMKWGKPPQYYCGLCVYSNSLQGNLLYTVYDNNKNLELLFFSFTVYTFILHLQTFLSGWLPKITI